MDQMKARWQLVVGRGGGGLSREALCVGRHNIQTIQNIVHLLADESEASVDIATLFKKKELYRPRSGAA